MFIELSKNKSLPIASIQEENGSIFIQQKVQN